MIHWGTSAVAGTLSSISSSLVGSAIGVGGASAVSHTVWKGWGPGLEDTGGASGGAELLAWLCMAAIAGILTAQSGEKAVWFFPQLQQVSRVVRQHPATGFE